MKHVTVVAAVISYEDTFLCMQRNVTRYDYISEKFEFPGGKIEPGETNEEALKREIREELDCEIDIKKHLITVEHEYPDFRITLFAYLCGAFSREFTLKEHLSFRWLKAEELDQLDWAAADLPVVRLLKRYAVSSSY